MGPANLHARFSIDLPGAADYACSGMGGGCDWAATMTILITGGSGFIGRHLVSALLARGRSVRIFDTVAPVNQPREAEFVGGSILDRSALRRALDGMHTVYHLAANAHLWSRDARDFDRVNRVGTETVLTAAAEARVRRLIHCSTEAILLPPRGHPHMVDEGSVERFADMAGPYTRSKFLAEQAALTAARAGTPVVIVNPTIPIGAGDRQMTPPTAMLARFLFKRSRMLLDCTLNLVDVRDVADGMMLAAERGRVGERYILGGENVRLRDLAQAVAQMSGRTASKWEIPGSLALAAAAACEWLATRVTHRPPAATIEGVQLALRSAPFDSGKARRELGYAPRPAQEAIVHAVSWLRSTVPAAHEPAEIAEAALARRGPPA
jgi:hopanoid-associated sugar epimerase